MRSREQAFVDHRQRTARHRKLKGVVGRRQTSGRPDARGGPEQPRFPASGGGCDAAAGHAAELPDQAVVRGCHDEAVAKTTRVDECEDRLDDRRLALLDLHVEIRVARQLDELRQGRHADAPAAEGKSLAVGGEAISGVEPAQLGQAEAFDEARAVGGAVDALIVKDHDLAVARRMQIRLEEAAAKPERSLERRQRVFRPESGAAAVRETERPFAAQHRPGLDRAHASDLSPAPRDLLAFQTRTRYPDVVPDLIRRFRWVALFEGVSFLLLLGIAMPLKYLAGEPIFVRVVGLAHGLLFLIYVALIAVLCARRQWSTSRGAEALALGLVPFGTFWLDRRIKRAPLA